MKNTKSLLMSILLLSSSFAFSGNTFSYNKNNNEDTKEKLNINFIKAAQEGHLMEMIELLESGADINAKESPNNSDTSLIWACYKGNTEIVDFLIKKKADLNSLDKLGQTPLICAINTTRYNINNYRKIVELLINAGADIYIKNLYGIETALSCADRYNDKYIYELLKAAQEKDIKEITEAISSDDKIKIANFIIKQPNFTDFEGNNALHIAAKNHKDLAFNVIWKLKPELFNKVNHSNQNPTDAFPEIILHLINSKRLSLKNKTEDKNINFSKQ